MTEQIERVGNTIRVMGDLWNFHLLLSLIHHCTEKAGYSDIVLDMSLCKSAFQNSMLSVCAQVMGYRGRGTEFKLVPPEDHRLQKLFQNTNWGHFLDPERYEPSNFRGYTTIPATQYRTPEEQQNAVNRIVNVMLGALPEMERSNFSAFEWSINELTDNVLVHSESTIGGLVQVSTFRRNTKRVQFVVADAGIGIPTSLRRGHTDIGSDTEALDRAIREGVTRDQRIGQGNGMYGSYRVCSRSGGKMLIDSGHARLTYGEPKGMSISDQKIPYSGTLVVATINFSNPELLADALQFHGKRHVSTDYVELKYEDNDGGPLRFSLKDESKSFGSRVAGRPVRVKLSNIIRMSEERAVVVDFEGVPVVSSSFADEAFGKLFLQLGPIKFMRCVRLVGMVDTVEALVNKALEQRMSIGLSDA